MFQESSILRVSVNFDGQTMLSGEWKRGDCLGVGTCAFQPITLSLGFSSEGTTLERRYFAQMQPHS